MATIPGGSKAALYAERQERVLKLARTLKSSGSQLPITTIKKHTYISPEHWTNQIPAW